MLIGLDTVRQHLGQRRRRSATTGRRASSSVWRQEPTYLSDCDFIPHDLTRMTGFEECDPRIARVRCLQLTQVYHTKVSLSFHAYTG